MILRICFIEFILKHDAAETAEAVFFMSLPLLNLIR